MRSVFLISCLHGIRFAESLYAFPENIMQKS
nr:MAG TPA: hypothetical protein [Caudoviricetes sp.]